MRFTHLLLVCFLLASVLMMGEGTVHAASSPEPEKVAREYLPKLERNLKENIIAFWYPRSLDTKNGGYHMSFDAEGKLKPGGTKMIVTQARMVWLFSRLARAGYGDQNLKAAEHGYRFLREKMWDEAHGGFYWEVDETGEKKTLPKKHLYGQSFALYALAEYARASGDIDALEFTLQFFSLLEEKAHDDLHGGYVEFFNEDWTLPPPEEVSYMGVPSRLKLMNTHLHLMEAMTALYRAAPLPLVRERLEELMTIESNTVVRKDRGFCTDKYERDWTPLLASDYARVSYGHDLENIWLLADAASALKVSNSPYLDLYKTLFANAMKYGYDSRRGGFYDSGPFHKRADNRAKTWWVEAEAMVSALYMYRLTHDPAYLKVFKETYDFIEKHQTDWKRGEWYSTAGETEGDKAHNWKAGYHNGRAMIEGMELLNEIAETSSKR